MRVLLALDDSAVSLAAARTARQLFGPEPDYLALQVGRTIPNGMVADPTGLYLLPDSYWNEELTRPDVDATQALAEAAGVHDAEVVTESGDPAGRICAVADEEDVDVIVVGASDKGFWRRLVDPSVSEGVIHHTDRPVLVVPERPGARQPAAAATGDAVTADSVTADAAVAAEVPA